MSLTGGILDATPLALQGNAMNIQRVFTALVAAGILVSTSSAFAAPREVLIEDLTLGHIRNDIHHRPERPGKVVRVVPWVGAEGGYSVIAITEVGWVYQSSDASSWQLVGRIFDSHPLGRDLD